ncbi:hypothetical protein CAUPRSCDRAFT_13293 [Caulochytrium protostelioides]|uniref:Secreted protein n=1 Tax=Caulochytrium protostelioides TaxID=1555241 RepID=A0A4V1ISV5_9FUNG|nr:hypothetical protein CAUPRSCDRAFT_13293 [Caulochytrium protostelioides]
MRIGTAVAVAVAALSLPATAAADSRRTRSRDTAACDGDSEDAVLQRCLRRLTSHVRVVSARGGLERCRRGGLLHAFQTPRRPPSSGLAAPLRPEPSERPCRGSCRALAERRSPWQGLPSAAAAAASLRRPRPMATTRARRATGPA